jgi:hypothetical protein
MDITFLCALWVVEVDAQAINIFPLSLTIEHKERQLAHWRHQQRLITNLPQQRDLFAGD